MSQRFKERRIIEEPQKGKSKTLRFFNKGVLLKDNETGHRIKVKCRMYFRRPAEPKKEL